MQTSALKLLAQKAKKRLSTAGQNYTNLDSDKTTLAYLSPASYAIVASRQKIEEDPLFEKVKKLLEKGDVINPLSELTDYSIFNLLSQTEKEKYIIDISKRYNKIKDYFLSHSKSE
jgi:hypothetical protein